MTRIEVRDIGPVTEFEYEFPGPGLHILRGAQGSGKAQPVDTQIPTPNGWRRIGGLRVGDVVFGSSGAPVRVVGVFPQGILHVARLEFRDRTTVDCCHDHLWSVVDLHGRTRVLSTRDILNVGVRNQQGRPRFKIPLCGPVAYPEAQLPIDPYVLGVLLGDGYICGTVAAISISDIDSDIAERVRSRLPPGHTLRKDTAPSCPRYLIKRADGTYRNEVLTHIRGLEIDVKSREKHIPRQYLEASVEQRWELLRGLMDTDGTTTAGRTSFSTTAPRLAAGIVELVQSLGGTAIQRGPEPRCGEISVNIKTFERPFIAQRKASNWRPYTGNPPCRYIWGITELGETECVCIAVDAEDSLYLTSNFAVTHNTTILRTVQLATDGRTDVKPQKRDGAPRGEAHVGGKRLRIAKQVREEGELGVEGLGDLDIAALHTPKFQDAATRDRHRIKTLVRLCGVRADASLFHGLLSDEQTFNEIVPVDSLETDDLVEMAARVKRAIEKEALRVEEREKTERANALAQSAAVDGVDVSVETDKEKLQTAWRAAIEEHAALKRQQSDADEVIGRAAKARAELAEFQGTAKPITEFEADLETANQRHVDAGAKIERLKRELESAEQEHRAAYEARATAAELLDQARRNEQLTAGWQRDIASAEQVERPTDEQLHRAFAAVTVASEAVARGAEARRASVARAKATEHTLEAERLATRARRLRDAAQDTARVLTEAIARIPHSPLRVRLSESGDPRLVLETDRSDHEAFDELSDGERWPIILQLASSRNRLIVLPQAAYGELSPNTRADLDALAKVHGCYILTAVADDGQLRGEAFQRSLAAE